MLKEEAKALYDANFGSLVFKFDSYYKYSFSYFGENENIRISTSYGGNADDIYRYSVENGSIELPSEFEELLNNYNYVSLTDKITGQEYVFTS